MPNQEPMIKVQDVRFRYDPEQPKYAVDGVSLDIRRGEFVAVLGANGCGKSTLAKHFNAILLPEAGTVLVEGMDTRNEDHLYDVRQKVGMVFQNPDNQIVATIVEEDVAFAPENLGVPPEEIRTRIDEAMKLAGIYEKREAAPYKLSGGQKQRVAIAGVIAMRPDCLVMDESTAMLDPHGRAQVMKTIRQLRAAGITIVSITHYMEEAAAIAKLIAVYGLSQEQAAERLGKSQSAVANKLRLLRLSPACVALLREGGLSERHARALLRLSDENERLAALRVIVERGCNVAQAETYIESVLQRAAVTPPRRRPTFIVKDVRLFLNTIRRSMGIMRRAGVDAAYEREDTDEEIRLTIRIPRTGAAKTA